jgi:hypothetical protein
MTLSNSVFGCIGVYTLFRYRWQEFDKTFVLRDSSARPADTTVMHGNAARLVVR